MPFKNIHHAINSGSFEQFKAFLEEHPNYDLNQKDKFHDTPLHTAIRTFKDDIARFLIAKGVKLDCYNGQGYTPLHLATLIGNTDIAKHLIDSNADINLKTPNGATAYTIAKINGRHDIITYIKESNHSPSYAPQYQNLRKKPKSTVPFVEELGQFCTFLRSRL